MEIDSTEMIVRKSEVEFLYDGLIFGSDLTKSLLQLVVSSNPVVHRWIFLFVICL